MDFKFQNGKSVWLIVLFWFVLGLVTSTPGLSTRGLHYDEITETRFALKQIGRAHV